MTDRGVRLPGAVLLALLPVVLTVGWLVVARWNLPSDGTVTGRSTDSWAGRTIAVDEVFAADSPLRTGDRVQAIDGVPVDRLAARPGALRAHRGQVLDYAVLRPGTGSAAPQRLDVQVELGRYPLRRGLAAHLSVFPLVATMYAVATFVIVRRPRQRVARALYAMAVLLPLTATSFPLGTQVVEVAAGRLWPFVAGDLGNCLLWGALLHFALVFPDPLPVVARRRWIVPIAYVLAFGYYLVQLGVFLPQSRDPLSRLRILVEISQPAAHIQPFLVAAAMVVGYRAAVDDLARRRMRWAFVTVAGAALAYLALGQLPSRLWGRPIIPWDWQVLLFVPFPVALGVAVLRYRLFDIEIILRRSLVFGTLTASLGGLYLLVVTSANSFDGLPSAAAPFVASLVVVVLFGPLRTQARRLVSRSLFGDRDDPYEVMSRLSKRLEATASADSVLATLVETLAETLRLSYAEIRLRGGSEPGIHYGVRTGSSVKVPIVHGGERVGELEIDAGPHREPFGVADQRLLDGLARQVGVISQNLMLEMRLRQSLERIVTAREEERRRLRRDLHDGLGPSLAAVGLQVDLAASLVETDPVRAREILAGLGAAHREAVVGLRRLVDGLRPPVLDRLGLVGALKESAEAFTVSVDAAPDDVSAQLTVTVLADGGVGPLPAAVEVAAFRIAQEALTNVTRHARAHRCDVRVWRDETALLLQVLDDGCGLQPGYQPGVGLDAIRERAAELGGSASITAGVRGGTLVFARLPVRTGS